MKGNNDARMTVIIFTAARESHPAEEPGLTHDDRTIGHQPRYAKAVSAAI